MGLDPHRRNWRPPSISKAWRRDWVREFRRIKLELVTACTGALARIPPAYRNPDARLAGRSTSVESEKTVMGGRMCLAEAADSTNESAIQPKRKNAVRLWRNNLPRDFTNRIAAPWPIGLAQSRPATCLDFRTMHQSRSCRIGEISTGPKALGRN